MEKKFSVQDSIDDIIGFLNEGNKSFKDPKKIEVSSPPDKVIAEDQYDSLSEFQTNYEEENKRKKEQFQINQQLSNENMQKILTPNDSFHNPPLGNNK